MFLDRRFLRYDTYQQWIQTRKYVARGGAEGGLAKKRTEDLLKPASVSQLTCVNQREVCERNLPRLRKHCRHRRDDRPCIFR